MMKYYKPKISLKINSHQLYNIYYKILTTNMKILNLDRFFIALENI